LYNALVSVILSVVSGQYSYTIYKTMGHGDTLKVRVYIHYYMNNAIVFH